MDNIIERLEAVVSKAESIKDTKDINETEVITNWESLDSKEYKELKDEIKQIKKLVASIPIQIENRFDEYYYSKNWITQLFNNSSVVLFCLYIPKTIKIIANEYTTYIIKKDSCIDLLFPKKYLENIKNNLKNYNTSDYPFLFMNINTDDLYISPDSQLSMFPFKKIENNSNIKKEHLKYFFDVFYEAYKEIESTLSDLSKVT